MPKLRRKGKGKPLRDAMEAAGLSGPELAEATKAIDPAGKGVSAATVGRITGRGKTARETCEENTAWLVAVALHRRTNAPLQDLFMPPHLTVTVERSIPDDQEEE
ncbi:XRE family transcriptional regulator [Streptomyces sp. LBUM 1479]|uniref:XRE family transcriptional regulator n=1 Tax=Streptomyces scabiei TaxID=1930 RepID=UPI001B338E46|nr:XRE family transcriptional regulator [Streptomyces scabiei]MBP5931864.1 XRE family transcriptional regulator [Streptomyces sp. LBUM 1479]MDX3033738.1 XRE family transcriptional regulator [Streptomyces scabiei]